MNIVLRAGELRHRLTIEKRNPRTNKNTYGEIADPWTLLTKRWGSLEALSSRNIELAKGVAASAQFECKLRYYPTIDNDCRILLDETYYYVTGVIQDPRRIWTLVFLTTQQS